VRNNADNLAYQCEKQLKEAGDKLSGDQKSEVESAVANVREALKGNDVEAIKTAYTALQEKFQAVMASAQGGAGPAGSAGASGAAAGGASRKQEGDVVDAEFEVVDEEGKK
jgi:molecular chaperone DnaK